jgi:hypothetical protein
LTKLTVLKMKSFLPVFLPPDDCLFSHQSLNSERKAIVCPHLQTGRIFAVKYSHPSVSKDLSRH